MSIFDTKGAAHVWTAPSLTKIARALACPEAIYRFRYKGVLGSMAFDVVAPRLGNDFFLGGGGLDPVRTSGFFAVSDRDWETKLEVE